MATVIDSLLIELGLDTSKFDASQKKSVDQLRKFDEQANKTFKSSQQGAKNLGDGFNKARDALISLGIAFVGIKGFTTLAQQMTTTNAGLGRTAELFKMNARELDAWGGVLKSVGGTAEDFQSSMQAIQQGVAGIQFGDTAILETLAKLQALDSYDYDKHEVDIYKLADAIKRFAEINGEQAAYTQAQAMGINRNFFMILKQGSGVVRELYGESYKLSGVTEENTKAAQKLQKEWGNVLNALEGAKNQIMDQMYPSLSKLAEITQYSLEKFVEWDKQLNGGLSTTAVFAGGLASIMAAFRLLGVTVATQIATVAKWGATIEGIVTAGWFTRFLGGIGLLTYSSGLNEGEDEEIRKIHEAQDKAMGKKTLPSTGAGAGRGGQGGADSPSNLPRNLRNNNPGNIEYGDFAKRMGATGSDGRFAIFPTMKAGEDAMANLLMSYAKGGTNTIASIINKWAPGSEKGNNPNSYINSVSKATGIDPNKPLSMNELTAVQKAMTNVEGMVGSRVQSPSGGTATNNTSSVNIQNMNIQTQATDSDGIAQSMKMSIENNSLVNYGMVGNR